MSAKHEANFSFCAPLPRETREYAVALFLRLEQRLEERYPDILGSPLVASHLSMLSEELPDVVLHPDDGAFIDQLADDVALLARAFPMVELNFAPHGLAIASGDTGGNAEAVAAILVQAMKRNGGDDLPLFVWTTDTTGGALRITKKGYESLDLTEEASLRQEFN